MSGFMGALTDFMERTLCYGCGDTAKAEALAANAEKMGLPRLCELLRGYCAAASAGDWEKACRYFAALHFFTVCAD